MTHKPSLIIMQVPVGWNFAKNSKYPDEFIELPFDVGVTFDKRLGRYVKTRTIQIKYSDRGTHVFPTKGRGDK